ncbi:unnamed protein product [Calicophoron daubneyi]|uniref:G-protein coupled receptors family 1 profile domain-containing protein n=1 Tax=Calicophoron daubneyi TaxID=300641 RepID=A0AAV2TX85_CALDB
MLNHCFENSTGAAILMTRSALSAAVEAVGLGLARDSQNFFTANSPVYKPTAPSQDSLAAFKPALLHLLANSFMESSSAYKCSTVYSLSSGPLLRRILQTCIQPFVMIFTLFTNCVIAVILTRPAMRNPTNTLLLAMAVANLLTVLLPLPIYLMFLTTSVFDKHLSIFKGYMVTYFTTILPTAFHTTTIWITVLLAVQRFVYVQFPLKAQRFFLCQTHLVVIAIFCAFLASLVLQLPGMLFTQFYYALSFCIHGSTQLSSNVSVIDSQYGRMSLGDSSLIKCTPMDETIFFLLLIFRVALVNFLPCTALVVLTTQLIVALHRFARKRHELLNKKREIQQASTGAAHYVTKFSNRPLSKKNSQDKDSVSKMMLVVLGIFLMVELPTTACLCVYAFDTLLQRSSTLLYQIVEICNFLVVLSYPANFFVYLIMSVQFRTTFAETFPICWNWFRSSNKICCRCKGRTKDNIQTKGTQELLIKKETIVSDEKRFPSSSSLQKTEFVNRPLQPGEPSSEKLEHVFVNSDY